MQSDKPPSEDEDEPEQQGWSREFELISYCYSGLCSWPLFLHLVMVLSLVWLAGYLQYNYPLVLFIAIFYLHKVDNVQKERLRIQIQNNMEERRSRMLLSTNAETVVWLNAILQECWPSWLERYLSHLITNCLHLNLAYYKPKALSKLVIDHLRLGSSPPVIQFARVHRNPILVRGEQAILELDITFVAAEDMKLELIARLKKVSMGLGLSAKLYGNNLRVEGKLRLGLKFVPFYPYLGQMTIAFATVPILGLSVRPLSSNSVDVTDLPGIASWVSRAIQAAVETFLVEPHPLVVDMIKLCGADYRFDVDKDGTYNRGNLKELNFKGVAFVILEILECKDLECRDRTGSLDPYVKIMLEKVKFKTSIKKQTMNPIWHELFRLRISSWTSPCRLMLRVRDRDVFGKDDELGCCFIDMDQLRGGKRHDMWLRLHGVKTGQIHVATTVVDTAGCRIATDPHHHEEGGTSSSAEDASQQQHHHRCPCEREPSLIVDDSVALRAKMKQVKVPPCAEHRHRLRQGPPPNNGLVDEASASYRPQIKHARVASVDSDRFDGILDPQLEREHGLPFMAAATGAPSDDMGPRAPQALLPSVAEKAPMQRWETDNVVPGKTRKRRTFMFLRPRGNSTGTHSSAASSVDEKGGAPSHGVGGVQNNNNVNPGSSSRSSVTSPLRSCHRMNLRALYRRMSSEFRSAPDPAGALYDGNVESSAPEVGRPSEDTVPKSPITE